MSTIFNDAITFLATRWEHRIRWRADLDDYNRLFYYASKIAAAGYGDHQIFGFVDGSFFQFCRPVNDQRRYCSGYYKGHGLKFQAIMTPDGMVNLSDFFPAPIGDADIWHQDDAYYKIDNMMLQKSVPLFSYGDHAYHQCAWVHAPYSHPNGHSLLPEDQRLFNAHLAEALVAVENGFGEVVKHWTYNSNKLGLKSLLQPVAAYYYTAGLFHNILCCLRGNPISKRFNCTPPTVEEYLAETEDNEEDSEGNNA